VALSGSNLRGSACSCWFGAVGPVAAACTGLSARCSSPALAPTSHAPALFRFCAGAPSSDLWNGAGESGRLWVDAAVGAGAVESAQPASVVAGGGVGQRLALLGRALWFALGLALFTTLFCSQNTTRSIDDTQYGPCDGPCNTNLTPGSECNPTLGLGLAPRVATEPRALRRPRRRRRRRRRGGACARGGGAVQAECSWTHSLNGAWFQPLHLKRDIVAR
jgi:hypothetical protein